MNPQAKAARKDWMKKRQKEEGKKLAKRIWIKTLKFILKCKEMSSYTIVTAHLEILWKLLLPLWRPLVN